MFYLTLKLHPLKEGEKHTPDNKPFEVGELVRMDQRWSVHKGEVYKILDASYFMKDSTPYVTYKLKCEGKYCPPLRDAVHSYESQFDALRVIY